MRKLLVPVLALALALSLVASGGEAAKWQGNAYAAEAENLRQAADGA